MSDKERFLGSLNPAMYQVFLFISPANMPFSFATHPWLVVNRKGVVSRFGVAMKKDVDTEKIFGDLPDQMSWGHVHRNKFPPWQGIQIFPFSSKFFWTGRLINFEEGDEGSVSRRMIDFIERSGETYPFKDHYSLFGPNSNTYVQWVLNNFPESHLGLPWNAFGKGKARHASEQS
ncbi:MAG: DUF3750 domain-containing protein [Patescibacteria group bacterium]